LNPPFGLTQFQFVLIVLGAVAVALIAFFGGRAYVSRRRDARRVARVTAGAADYLRNVLVPDGNGGVFHLDFVLLTSRGIVVIDMPWRRIRRSKAASCSPSAPSSRRDCRASP
jgi:hypothetical protein